MSPEERRWAKRSAAQFLVKRMRSRRRSFPLWTADPRGANEERRILRLLACSSSRRAERTASERHFVTLRQMKRAVQPRSCTLRAGSSRPEGRLAATNSSGGVAPLVQPRPGFRPVRRKGLQAAACAECGRSRGKMADELAASKAATVAHSHWAPVGFEGCGGGGKLLTRGHWPMRLARWAQTKRLGRLAPETATAPSRPDWLCLSQLKLGVLRLGTGATSALTGRE